MHALTLSYWLVSMRLTKVGAHVGPSVAAGTAHIGRLPETGLPPASLAWNTMGPECDSADSIYTEVAGYNAMHHLGVPAAATAATQPFSCGSSEESCPITLARSMGLGTSLDSPFDMPSSEHDGFMAGVLAPSAFAEPAFDLMSGSLDPTSLNSGMSPSGLDLDWPGAGPELFCCGGPEATPGAPLVVARSCGHAARINGCPNSTC